LLYITATINYACIYNNNYKYKPLFSEAPVNLRMDAPLASSEALGLGNLSSRSAALEICGFGYTHHDV